MFCKHCGKELEDDSRFCPYCGKEVTLSKVAGDKGMISVQEEQGAGGQEKSGIGWRKAVIAICVVIGLLALGIGIFALADYAKQNKKTGYDEWTAMQTSGPTNTPTTMWTITPTVIPTLEPTSEPTAIPTPEATAEPTPTPTTTPVPEDTLAGTYEITVWVPEKIIELTKKQIERFCKENPEIEIEVMIKAVSESDSAKQMLNDVAGGADLFCFTQEQLASLVLAEVLSVPDERTKSIIRIGNDGGSVRAATVGQELYCYPLTSHNGYFMYYDKSVVKDTHIDSLEDIIADCENAGRKFSMELENGWYNVAFLFATGCVSEWTVDKTTGAVTVLDTFNSEQGLAALKGMQTLMKSLAYKNSCYSSDFEGKNSSAVVVTGAWESDAIKQILGDNYGVADLPSFTVDGTEYHMSSFSGNKLLGVKQQEDTEKETVLHMLALYLSGETCQMERLEVNQSAWVPCNISAQANKTVKKEPTLAALTEQNHYAVPQGNIQGMWWEFSRELAVATKNATSDRELAAALQCYDYSMRDAYSVISESMPEPTESPKATATPKPTEKPKSTATPTPTEKPKSTVTPKPTEKPKPTATPKPAAGTYTKKSVLTGKTISADAGTGTVVYMEEGRADESVLVPDFEAWNEGKFTGKSESRTTYMSFQRKAGKTPGLDVAEAYIKLLKDEYGFSVKQTVDQGPDWIGKFEYIWECTKNGFTMEVSLFGLTEMPEYFTFECTKDFLFVDSGERLSGNNEKVDVSGMNAKGTPKTYSVTTTCAVMDGFAAINTSTWIDNHLMGFVLSPDYEKGKILDQSEFEKYNMLTAYKCYAEFIYASGDKGFISTHEDFEDQIEDIKVEILDTKNGYPAVYFYAQIVDDAYTRYYIEGILAPGEDDIMPSTSSGGDASGGVSSDGGYIGSVPSVGTTKCTYCEYGYVDCMACNGNGSYTCKVCKGVGSVSHYGYTSDCSCTNGIQYCTNPYCNGGKKKCNICGGRGYR